MNVSMRVVLAMFVLLALTGGAAAQDLTIIPADPGIGVGQSLAFTALSIRDVSAIEAGAFHNCARMQDGSLRCWGLNDWGQLGDGSFSNSPVPVQVAGISGATGFAGGGYHTCAQFPNGTIECWGMNTSRQLGDPNTTTDSSPTPVPVGITSAVSVSAGVYHTCAQLSDASVRCWGKNDGGQLGNGTILDSATPVTPVALPPVVSVSAGGWHTCVLLADGTIRCWGKNDDGQLGNGTTVMSLVPTPVSGITNAVALKAWIFTTCALLADSTVRCWGRNGDAQLGNGTATTPSPTPTQVVGLSGVVAVSPGAEHGCAQFGDGTLRCWGDNNFGQLGNGSASLNSPTPSDPVTGISGASMVTSGAVHSCALLPGGEVRCWGQNNWNQMGDGTLIDRRTPSPVAAADVTWSSSDAGVASITARGVATGVSPGGTTITATSGPRTGSTSLTVFARPVLTVVREGLGTGTVTSSPAGIDCGSACSAPFNANTTVTLTATAGIGSTFQGWTGGGCSGTGSCTITLGANTTVTARFGVGLPGL